MAPPPPARPGEAEAGEARRCWEGREVIDFGLWSAQKGVKREITPSSLEVSQQAARGVNSQQLSVFSVELCFAMRLESCLEISKELAGAQSRLSSWGAAGRSPSQPGSAHRTSAAGSLILQP